MSDKPKRFDERLTQEANNAIRTLLANYPELAAVAIVFAYDFQDAGSLPGSVIEFSDGKADTGAILRMCAALDTAGLTLRREHDRAVEIFSNQLKAKKGSASGQEDKE